MNRQHHPDLMLPFKFWKTYRREHG